jgi:hypothetical protein
VAGPIKIVQQKLWRSTRAELVRYALDHGLRDETD